MKQLLFVFAILTGFESCLAQNENYQKERATGYRGLIIKNLKAVKGLNFCVIGDWGRYGDYYQKAVANQLSSAVTGVGASLLFLPAITFILMGL